MECTTIARPIYIVGASELLPSLFWVNIEWKVSFGDGPVRMAGYFTITKDNYHCLQDMFSGEDSEIYGGFQSGCIKTFDDIVETGLVVDDQPQYINSFPKSLLLDKIEEALKDMNLTGVPDCHTDWLSNLQLE